MNKFSEALLQSIKLNDKSLMQEVIECTPSNQISLITASLPINYVEKLLSYLAWALENTVHIEFYMNWITCLLSQHGVLLKSNISADSLSSILRHLHQSITLPYQDLAKICEHNKYLLKFIPILAKHAKPTTNLIEEEAMLDD